MSDRCSLGNRTQERGNARVLLRTQAGKPTVFAIRPLWFWGRFSLRAERARLRVVRAHMTRAIWKVSISFGLIEIPAALVAGEESNELAFHRIDKRTLSGVGTKRFHKDTRENVEWDDIVRDYRYEALAQPDDMLAAPTSATPGRRTVIVQTQEPLQSA